ncbi:group II intron maturase-specific domain-containing protein, partial [Thermincola ferriacetica]
ALLNILQPIFEPDFHPSSYGYRPGRSCQQAVAKAEMFMNKYGLSYVVDMDQVAYLRFVIYSKSVSISPKKLKNFRDKIRKMTPRNHGLSVKEMVEKLNPVLRGWANYFRIANCRTVFAELMG